MNDESSHLEPRVARLETGLETLTRNVSEMAVAMRENAIATNSKIDQLAIAVTQAAAPKKTDWSLLLSIGFFILALGSAVFWPLNKSASDNKDAIKELHTTFVEHTKLPLHPVGGARIDGMEKAIDATKAELVVRDNALDNKLQTESRLLTDLVNTRITDLDVRIQKEFDLKNQIVQAQIIGVNSKQDLVNERVYARVLKLEAYNTEEHSKDMDELRKWRLGELQHK